MGAVVALSLIGDEEQSVHYRWLHPLSLARPVWTLARCWLGRVEGTAFFHRRRVCVCVCSSELPSYAASPVTVAIMFTARKKIVKEKGADPDAFEESVAQVWDA